MIPFQYVGLDCTATEPYYFASPAGLDKEEITAFELILAGAGLEGRFEKNT